MRGPCARQRMKPADPQGSVLRLGRREPPPHRGIWSRHKTLPAGVPAPGSHHSQAASSLFIFQNKTKNHSIYLRRTRNHSYELYATCSQNIRPAVGEEGSRRRWDRPQAGTRRSLLPAPRLFPAATQAAMGGLPRGQKTSGSPLAPPSPREVLSVHGGGGQVRARGRWRMQTTRQPGPWAFPGKG